MDIHARRRNRFWCIVAPVATSGLLRGAYCTPRHRLLLLSVVVVVVVLPIFVQPCSARCFVCLRCRTKRYYYYTYLVQQYIMSTIVCIEEDEEETDECTASSCCDDSGRDCSSSSSSSSCLLLLLLLQQLLLLVRVGVGVGVGGTLVAPPPTNDKKGREKKHDPRRGIYKRHTAVLVLVLVLVSVCRRRCRCWCWCWYYCSGSCRRCCFLRSLLFPKGTYLPHPSFLAKMR